LRKLNAAFAPESFGPDFSFPKTRGDYKGGKVQTMKVDLTLLYPMDRPLRYAGWIKSRRKVFGGWQSGFCVLENGSLLWYRDEAQTSLKRQFSLAETTLAFHLDDPSTISPTCVCVSATAPGPGRDDGRKFILKFQEKASRGSWLSYLRAHEEWAHLRILRDWRKTLSDDPIG
jgi:hypothetical protein